MKINSTREVNGAFAGINSLNDLPKKVEIQNKGAWVTLEKIGGGLAGGKPQVAYMGPETEMITVSYEQDGVGIKVIEAKFRDVDTMNTSNAVPAGSAI
jgi:hypothetical protein